MNERYIRTIKIDKVGGESYLARLPAVKHIVESGGIDLDSEVTFFVGENGTGKSTLLEAAAVAFGFNPEGGTLNFSFSTFDSHSDLYKNIRLVKGFKRPRDGYFLRAESFYNVASYINMLDDDPIANGLGAAKVIESYGGVPLHCQSHGESFFSLVMNRFGGSGLYILDEPEAALSPMRQMSLLSRIKELADDGSQFIIATHSPILLAYPNSCIYELDEKGIRLTEYEKTQTYEVTKRFLDDPKKMLKYLFE